VVYTDNSTNSMRQSPAIWKDSPQAAIIPIDTDKTVAMVTLEGGIFIDVTPQDNVWNNPETAPAEITATPEVTATAPVTVTVEATTTLPSSDELMQLQANSWQWVSFNGPVETFVVDDPASYTITFNNDGTITIVADCNNASAFYASEGGSLNIDMGPSTVVACVEGSRSELLLTILPFVTNYFFEDGYLHIDLLTDGGTLVFAPIEE
jgi:heat shock protein HslJ